MEHSYQSAKNRLEQISDNESWYKQNSQSIKRTLNDDFLKWTDTKVEGGYSGVLNMLSRDYQEEIQPLVQEFISSYLPENTISALSKESFSQNISEERACILEKKQNNDAIVQDDLLVFGCNAKLVCIRIGS